MSCLRTIDIDLYLEGALDAPEKEDAARHLEGCAACREWLEERRLLLEALSSLPPVEVPTGFAAAVMSALPESRAAAKSNRPAVLAGVLAWYAGLAGLVLLLPRLFPGVILGAGRALVGLIESSGLFLVRLLKAGQVLLKTILSLISLLRQGLVGLASFVEPAALVVGLAALCLAALAAAFGLKRITSFGART
jgi:hypothetical protein